MAGTFIPRISVTAATMARAIVYDPYDFAQQQLADAPARINTWKAGLEIARQSTLYLAQERARRYSGARQEPLNGPTMNPESYGYLMPLEGDACPEGGALAYVWIDIFNEAKANLAWLAANPPPRFCELDPLNTWSLLIRWNVALLVDATNIRPMFLFPTNGQATLTQKTDMGGGRLVDGKDHLSEYHVRQFAERPHGRFGHGGDNVLPFDGGAEYFGQHIGFDARIAFGYLPNGAQGDTLFPAGPGDYVLRTTPLVQNSLPAKNALARFWVSLAPQPMKLAPPGLPVIETSWDVAKWIRQMGGWARAYSQLDLTAELVAATGFYVNNHIPWWIGRGYTSLDTEAVRAAQQYMRAQQARAGFSSVQGLIGAGAGLAAALSSVSAIGGVFGTLSSIGTELFINFVVNAQTVDAPRHLFVRLPWSQSCIPTDIRQYAPSPPVQPPPPRIDEGGFPLQPSNTTPVLVVGGLLLGAGALAVLFLRR